MSTIKYSRHAKRGILRALKGARGYLLHPDNPGGYCRYICGAISEGRTKQDLRYNGRITELDVDMAREMIDHRLGKSPTYFNWIDLNHHEYLQLDVQIGRAQWLEAMIVEFANPVYPKK